MSNIYNHRTMVPSSAPTNRIPDLLDALKVEFEALSQEVSMGKGQKDDGDNKANLAELVAIQQHLTELQRSHLQIKQKYEDDIARLQKELEMRGGPQAPGNTAAHPPAHSQPAPPTIGHGQSTILGNMMSGGGAGGPQPELVAPSPMMGHTNSPNGAAQPPGPHPGYPPYANGATTPQQPPKRLRSDTNESMHHPPPGSQPPGYPAGYAPSAPAPHTPHDKTGNPMKPTTPTANNPSGGPGQPTTPTGSGHMAKDQSATAAAGAVVPKRKVSGSSTTGPPSRPMTNKAGGPPTGMSELDPTTVPSDLKIEGVDWFAIFNPKLPRSLEMDMLHSLDHSSVVCCVRFSNDGKLLATGCNRTAQIFDVNTGGLVITLNDESVPKEGDLYIRSVCFSPDGKYLATGAEDKLIRIWDLASKRICHTLRGHEQDIYSLDYSQDGRVIVSGSGDRTARLWDATTGTGLFSLAIDDLGPKDAGVTSVAISPDGRYVAAGSLDRMVRVWDAQTGYMLERLEGHKDSVYSVTFTPDGASLISGSLDKTIKIWDLTNLPRNGGPGTASGGSSNGAGNPSGSAGSGSGVGGPAAGTSNGGGNSGPNSGGAPKASPCRATLSGHKDFVLSVACSPCGRWIVSGSKDRSVQFWDAHTTNTQFMLQGHKNSVISVSLSPAGGLFATGSGDCRARIWSYRQLKQ
ncbi:general transcription repressor [Dimargaris verticillata]|uniref:General transcription repressor n=1 Tax=Dimargaris verticillata TaxID=2761393 RepID=A0A9W8B1E1_9FUNG|nr:general transcription repressor [Dimargaris verticillata]